MTATTMRAQIVSREHPRPKRAPMSSRASPNSSLAMRSGIKISLLLAVVAEAQHGDALDRAVEAIEELQAL